MLQTVQASPLDAGAGTANADTVTITFAEDGIAHIRDLLFLATADDVAASGTELTNADVSRIVQATTLTLNGGREFLRSRGTIRGLNPFVWRDRNFCAFPNVKVGSGDTLAFTGYYNRTALDSVWSIGVPFTPDSQRRGSNDRAMFGRDEVWVPSPEVATTADSTPATLTTTFDDHGYVDLSRLAVHAGATAFPNVAADGFTPDAHDDVPLSILDIHIRSEGNLINGQGTPVSPNFWRRGRNRNLVDLGVHSVAPGDTLSIVLEANTTTLLDGFAYSGVPMVITQGKAGRCR